MARVWIDKGLDEVWMLFLLSQLILLSSVNSPHSRLIMRFPVSHPMRLRIHPYEALDTNKLWWWRWDSSSRRRIVMFCPSSVKIRLAKATSFAWARLHSLPAGCWSAMPKVTAFPSDAVNKEWIGRILGNSESARCLTADTRLNCPSTNLWIHWASLRTHCKIPNTLRIKKLTPASPSSSFLLV